MRHTRSLPAAAALLFFAVQAARAADETTTTLDEVVVTATRSETAVQAVPASVTVIRREELQEQLAIQPNLGSALGKLVPGLALGSESTTSYGQTLRGRGVAVLIDGVPQNTVRNGARNLFVIDPSAIERVEVIRGSTAIYGNGATGGVVNLITKRPAKGKPEYALDVGTAFSLSHPGDSLSGRISPRVSAKSGKLDALLSFSAEHVGGYFDADGDRVPPDPFGQGGLSDTDSYNLLSKIGYDIDNEQRLQLTLNHFKSEQDTEYTTDPSVRDPNVNKSSGGADPTSKARAIPVLQLDEPQASDNTQLSLDYNHKALFGSKLHAQVFYRDYMTRFAPYDGRTVASVGRNAYQSRIESQNLGGRLELTTPLGSLPGKLSWGLDYSRESTEQRMAIMDKNACAPTSCTVFRKVDDKGWTPVIDMNSLGAFAQSEWSLGEQWLVHAGLRHERVDVQVDDFVTVAGNRMKGGEEDFSATLYNLGLVFFPTDRLSLYGSFSQGFSVPDFGLVFRTAPNNSSMQALQIQPQKVDNYELGLRGGWNDWNATLAFFYNRSELGTTSPGIGLPPLRAPERIWGFEATLDAKLTEAARFGATVTRTEGKQDPNRNGQWRPLNNYRIPPLKITTYLEHDTLPAWSNRLQLQFSGSRDKFGADTAFGNRKVDRYTTVDWISRVRLSPKSSLTLGIENLFNHQYYPRESQLLWSGDNDSHSAARGAYFSATLSTRW